jgi:small subunit ribosomal protein S18
MMEETPLPVSETPQVEARPDGPANQGTAPGPARRPVGGGAGRPAGRVGGPGPRRNDPYRGGGDEMPNPAMKGRRRSFRRRKVCAFCVEKVTTIDYKNVSRVRKFLSERGKIVPRRQSGNCAKHQRILCTAIKRAREMALVPYIVQ